MYLRLHVFDPFQHWQNGRAKLLGTSKRVLIVFDLVYPASLDRGAASILLARILRTACVEPNALVA